MPKEIIYDINRPWLTLDPWQLEYINMDPEQDCFLLKGRQSGGTTAMSIKSVKLCVKDYKKGEFVLINSITEKQGYIMLAKALAYAEEKYPGQIDRRKDEKPTKHRIMFKNGTGILCYAAGEAGEGLRGFTIKKLMSDEGSRMSVEYFIATLPMLSVVKGSLDITSTPFGKRHKDGSEKFFYKCSKDPSFKKIYVSAEDCPRHTKEFLAKAKERMTKLQYAQEYLAIFTDELIQYFNPEDIEDCCTGKRPETIIPGHYFLGCDVARKGIDKFTYEIFKRTGTRNNYKVQQVENIFTTNVPIPESTRRIIELNSKYNFKKEYIDSGGMGITVCDILREDRINKRKVVEINNASRVYLKEDGEEKDHKIFKQNLYENLAKLIEQKRITFLDDDEVKASLNSIQYEYTKTDKLHIWGYDDHITEGITRAAWCTKDKTLNIMAFC